MIIGLCGDAFPDLWGALRCALPQAELVNVLDVSPGATSRVDVLVPLGTTVDEAMLEATTPRLIQQFGVGLQGVDIAAARARGIPVTYLPAAETGNATAVAEITVLHILALLRRYEQAKHSVARQRIGQPSGSTLAGKTVTVLGVGAIGTAVISRLDAFAAIPLGIGRREHADYPALDGLLPRGQYYRIGEVADALSRSHILVICCPLTEQTRGLIGEEHLATMPEGAYVINVARGAIVDYSALLDALRRGRIAGAGLDVAWDEPVDPDDELLHENVTITPHIGGVTAESYAGMAERFAVNVDNLRTGSPIAHRVD